MRMNFKKPAVLLLTLAVLVLFGKTLSTISNEVRAESTTPAVDDYVYIPENDGGSLKLVRLNKYDDTLHVITVEASGAEATGIAVDNNSVWLTSRLTNKLYKIDKLTNEITPYEVFPSPYGVAVDDEFVWTANNGGTSVTKIDKATSLQSNIEIGCNPVFIAVDNEYAWTVCFYEKKLIKINRTTNSIEEEFTLSDSPHGVAVDGTHVWVLMLFDRKLAKLDKATGEITYIPGTGSPTLQLDDSSAWVTYFEGNEIHRINKSDNSYIAAIPVGEGPHGIAVDNGQFAWAVNHLSGTISKIDKGSNSVVNTISGLTLPQMMGDGTGVSYDRFFTPEVVGPPTDKDQCKKDGWKTFNNPVFKNQGDCVSFVNHN